MPGKQIFAKLRAPSRVWAVASIHGEAERLRSVHDQILPRLAPGDRIVYLGNALGVGPAVRETVEELLRFRRAFLARPRVFACDVAFVRGTQEEMWRKLLELQFAPNPREVLRWMLDRGVGATLAAFGGDAERGFASARDGPRSITRWTNGLREAMRGTPGFVEFLAALRHAAYGEDGALLFVHAGLDPERPLGAQSDGFWWDWAGFSRIATAYSGFRRIVRGYDPAHAGVVEREHTLSLDDGCGFGGPLIAACLDRHGRCVDLLRSRDR